MKAVAYVRVSGLAQVEGYSLDAQERLFRELCKSRGWEIGAIYREEGKSAHVETIAARPLFKRLLDDAARKQFDIVVVHTLDRWARSLKVTLESLTLLGTHNIGLVSISENIDYSTAQGKLFTQMIGAFAQYYSEALSVHVRKGQQQRVVEGKHNGHPPFGYETCWTSDAKGRRKARCEPEHPGGMHVHPDQGNAVRRLFQLYASGSARPGELAAQLNTQGFRTHNLRKIPDVQGNLLVVPAIFTSRSVRRMLHNDFYTGIISYNGKTYHGLHKSLVSQALFQKVQALLKENYGKPIFGVKRVREYLLKDIICCAYCGTTMWSSANSDGRTYYKERKPTRIHGTCSPGGSCISSRTPDEQVQQLLSAIEITPQWLESALSIISHRDEIEEVNRERQTIQQKLHRLAQTYVDGLTRDDAYHLQKKFLEVQMESLVMPGPNAEEDARNLILDFQRLWSAANLEERSKLLRTMLDAVYVDAKKTRSIIAVKPKPPFVFVFRAAAAKLDTKINIISESFEVKSGEGVVSQTLPQQVETNDMGTNESISSDQHWVH